MVNCLDSQTTPYADTADDSKNVAIGHHQQGLECPIERLKTLNGTELFNKWVGGSEADIRGLFAPVRKGKVQLGSQSSLYMFAIDEMTLS